MSVKIAINGFGRIGRCAYKIGLERSDVEIVAVNDLAEPEVLLQLLKYDSAYGPFAKEVKIEDGCFVIDKKKTKIFCEKDPAKLPWGQLNIDVVLECTGVFTEGEASKVHIAAGAKKVVVSAPVKGEGVDTFLIGVNDDKYQGQQVISNASCTTNCVAPVLHVIHANFKVLKALMTTVHAITAGQNVVDGPPPGRKPDMRRARSVLNNIIPTSSGAEKAVAQAIPELKGIFDGVAVRVPVITGSLVDLVTLVGKKTTVEEVNKAFVVASMDPFYKGVIGVTNDPIVSSDIIKSSYSAIVDLSMTKVVDGDLLKVFAWYDNEWGYTVRLVEMALKVMS